MGKRNLPFCLAPMVMLARNCGDKIIDLLSELPETEKITAVKATAPERFSGECSDSEWMERLIAVVSGTPVTDNALIQSHPALDEYGAGGILHGDKAIETIYFIREDGKGYLAKPYQGIYETDRMHEKSCHRICGEEVIWDAFYGKNVETAL